MMIAAQSNEFISMGDLPELPSEIQRLAERLANEPPHVREIFRYALVLAMIDEERAHIVESRLDNGREY